MRGRGSGGGKVVGIVAIIGLILFLISRGGSASAFLGTIGWIFLGVFGVAVIALVLIIVFAAKAGKKVVSGMSSSKNKLNEEQSAVINNGRQELMTIRRKLVTIKNSEIRSKGNKVCASMDRVFKILKEKPEKIPTTRQFLNYYLPTVSKVIQKYQRLEANGVPAADMTAKIKKFLDDVDAAMDKQCTHLYEDDKLDMAVDMEAMTIAIKKDGLLDEADFPTHAGNLNSIADDFNAHSDAILHDLEAQVAAEAEPALKQEPQVQTIPPQQK